VITLNRELLNPEYFIRVEGLIPKNPLARGSLWGGHKGFKPKYLMRKTNPVRSAAGLVDSIYHFSINPR
jgi:hypothetical protein